MQKINEEVDCHTTEAIAVDEITMDSPQNMISIDWGRQGGVIVGIILVILCYYAFIVNTWMLNANNDWISFLNMDPSILFWTYPAYLSQKTNVVVFLLLLIVLMLAIIIVSLLKQNTSIVLLILIPIYFIFVSDLYWNLFDIGTVISTEEIYITWAGFSLISLFLICFVQTYREDIPLYGIKFALWMVPLLFVLGCVFYGVMFGLSVEPLVYQFGNGKGYLNLLLLYLTVLSGSLSGMKLKKEFVSRKKTAAL